MLWSEHLDNRRITLNYCSSQWGVLVGKNTRSRTAGKAPLMHLTTVWRDGLSDCTSRPTAFSLFRLAFHRPLVRLAVHWLMGTPSRMPAFPRALKVGLRVKTQWKICRRGSVEFRISCSSLDIITEASALLCWGWNPGKHNGMCHDKFHVAQQCQRA